jgi:heme/copper-type cytochrome/quinol oxidase subunit 1
MDIRHRPYHLLIPAGLLLVLTSLFMLNQKNTVVDIHLHDTYFVIAQNHIFWLLSIITFFIWLLYFLTNKILYAKVLTWTHVILTILTLLLLVSTLYFGDSILGPIAGGYIDISHVKSFDQYRTYSKSVEISILVLFLGQVIFVVNVILGLLKRYI